MDTKMTTLAEIDPKGDIAAEIAPRDTPGLVECQSHSQHFFVRWSSRLAMLHRLDFSSVDPALGAHRLDISWTTWLPPRPLIGDDGDMHPAWMIERTERALSRASRLANDGAKQEALRAAAARARAVETLWRRYVAEIPLEARRAVAPFARAQWTLLRAIAARPALAADIGKEVRAAGPGYLNACLGLLNIFDETNETVARHVQAALREPRAKFLSRLTGRRLSRSTVGLLSKLDDMPAHWAARCLARMAEAGALDWLRHARTIAAANLRLLHNVPSRLRAAIAPVVMRLPNAPALFIVEQTLDTLARAARTATPAAIADLARLARTKAPVDDLDEFVEAWVKRLKPSRARKAPAPPFPGTDRLVHLDTIDAIRDAGERFRNCLAEHGSLDSDFALYEWRGRTAAILGLTHTGGGYWAIAEISGANNAKVPAATRRQIAREVYQRLANQLRR